jgi:hypothetical protein
MALPGEVYRDDAYPITEGTKTKYIVLLCQDRAGDWVYALSTSQQHGRSENPRCNHGTLPSFYLGIVAGIFPIPTWIDLMHPCVEDSTDLAKKIRAQKWTSRGMVPQELFKLLLDCASRAEDFDPRQAQSLRDTLAELP